MEVLSQAEVCCPLTITCGKEWKIDDIVAAADLSEREKSNLENILNHRKLMKSFDFKQCPQCETLVELPDRVNLIRVRCPSKLCKNKPDFCWLCNSTWKGNGLTICGNKDCHTAFINDMLKIENCGTTDKILKRGDVVCPTLRACPRCLTVSRYYIYTYLIGYINC